MKRLGPVSGGSGTLSPDVQQDFIKGLNEFAETSLKKKCQQGKNSAELVTDSLLDEVCSQYRIRTRCAGPRLSSASTEGRPWTWLAVSSTAPAALHP